MASARVAEQIGAHLTKAKSHLILMNVDDVTAVIFAELGFDAPLASGLFYLSRNRCRPCLRGLSS